MVGRNSQRPCSRSYRCHPTVREMGLELLLKYAANDRCRPCTCKSDIDAGCMARCNPMDIFKDQLSLLRAGNWVDNGTRAVVLDASLFFQNQNLFTTALRTLCCLQVLRARVYILLRR